MKKISFVVLMTLLVSPGIDAQENYLSVGDTLKTTIPIEGFYDAIDISNDGIMYALAGDTVFLTNLASGLRVDTLVVTDQTYSGYPTFITLDPGNNDVSSKSSQ